MKNISKKNLTFMFIAALFIIVAIPTSYKIIKNYNNKSYLVIEKKIKEAATKCYLEEKCQGKEITLKDLYDNNYLDTVVNPVTKKIYDDDLIIKKSKNDFIFNIR